MYLLNTLSYVPECLLEMHILSSKSKIRREAHIQLTVFNNIYLFLLLSFFSLIFCEILPGGSVSEEYACNVGDLGLILGLGRSPGEGDGKPLQYSCLENPHGHRGLEGCSPWGCRESEMTERLSTQG